MTIEEFKASIKESEPPSELSMLLKALWYDGKGNWDKAHELAQDVNNHEGAWVHAFLHRKEGDVSNASYWYNRANKKIPSQSLDQEWESISQALLEK